MVASLALILGSTLWPSSAREPVLALHAPAAADLIRNVLMFVPFGAALAAGGLRAGPALALAFGATAAIESLQLAIPGRTATPWDLLENLVGAGLGIGLARTQHAWRDPSPDRGARLALGAGLAALVVLTGTALLARPAPPSGIWFAHWTPAFGHLEAYDGRLLDVRLAARPLPHSRLGRDPAPFRAALAGDFELRLDALAGSPPRSLAPLLAVLVADSAEALLVGAEGTDLVVRIHTRARTLGFEPRAFRFPGALRDLRPGTRFELRVRRTGGRIRPEIDGRPLPTATATLGDGWALWLPQSLIPAACHPLANAGWVAALFLPLGFWAERRVAWALAVVAATGALAGLPLATSVAPTPVSQYLGALAGLIVGRPLRWWLRSGPPPPSPGLRPAGVPPG